MRRTIFSIFGFLAIFAMLFTVSCSNEPEIVPETFDKTVLTVTAYPGMNFISWTPVVDAIGYTLYKHEGNVCVCAEPYSSTDELYYVDDEVKNGVEYSYLVEVELKPTSNYVNDYANVTLDPAFPKQMSERVAAKAIVPDHTVNALKLTDFENPAGNADFVVNSENMHIAKHHTAKGDMISYSFPSKAYLKYKYFITGENELEVTDSDTRVETLRYYDFKSYPINNDVTFSGVQPITQSGTYRLVVVAYSVNPQFAPSEYIISSESVEIAELTGNGASNIYACYKDDGKNVRILFDEFILSNGSSAPKSYYKLYRSEEGSRDYSLVEAEIKATDSTNKRFFVDDAIADNTKNYVYTLVVTDGCSYRKNAESFTIDRWRDDPVQDEVDITGIQSSKIDTKVTGEQTTTVIEWTIELPENEDVKFKGAYVLEKSLKDISVPFATEFDLTKPIEVKQDEEDKFLFTAETTHPVDKKVYILVVTEQEDYAIGEWVSDCVITKPLRVAYFCDDKGVSILDPIGGPGDSYTVTLPELPEVKGYDGLYWKDKDDNIFVSSSNVVLTDLATTFTAVYQEEGLRIALFVDEDGNTLAETIKAKADNYTIKLPKVTAPAGKIILGWENQNTGAVDKLESDVTLRLPITYFVIRYAETYKVSFIGNGDTTVVTLVESLDNNSWNVIEMPVLAPVAGYDVYWYQKNADRKVTSSYVTLNADEIFEYTKRLLESRKAYFIDESGSFIEDTITVNESLDNYSWNKIELPEIPSKSGYVALYWIDSYGNIVYPMTYTNLTISETYFTAVYDANLEVGPNYQIGYADESGEVYYTFYVQAGYSYNVYWMDGYDNGGKSELENLLSNNSIGGSTLDVKVSIYSEDGSNDVCSGIDSGYASPQYFTAQTTGYYVIKVEPYNLGDMGYFAVKVEQN